LCIFLPYTAGEILEPLPVCEELQHLRDSGNTDSAEQVLVRQGEMTPFGTMMSNSSQVNTLEVTFSVIMVNDRPSYTVANCRRLSFSGCHLPCLE